MDATQYRQTMGKLFHRLGRQTLEGRFVALLLCRSQPISLGEAARELAVTKTAMSKLATTMLERGDIKRAGRYSTREHTYDLVDDVYIADLREWREVSRLISDASSEVAADPTTSDPGAVKRLHYQAAVHGQVVSNLDQTLSREEKLQAADLRKHHEESWDAIPPKERRERKKRPTSD